MRRWKTAMPCLWAILTMIVGVWPFAPAAHAQGSRKDDVVFNSRGVPLAGASVRVCAMPATGQPCSPLALIYSDAALTQALPNPTAADGLGNYTFYAAPGRYMVEISGPGIATRQIPDVILPSDPTAPSFSSLASTGGISAFSLSLTGNLTVNGNTTVAGSLGSGTLNLTNQFTPPGAAGAGTVNLYTKSADKRLYYKDDSGTEIGPIASTTGVQVNVSNTFTAQQNFDANTAYKGPNPWFDITRYGGVASTQSTTGGMTGGSATLTLAGARDFANGQGIVVWGAGGAPALSTPTAVAVSPQYISGGSTTYSYKIACEDFAGGITAASSAGSSTTGAALLGVQNAISITSAVRAGGVVTVTTAANHTFSTGMPVNLAGVSDPTMNGTVIVASTPTSTTFTFSQATAPNSSAASGSVQGIAYNKVTWSSADLNANTVLRCWIYRNNALAGVAPGEDNYFEDYGAGIGNQPGYVPATPPSSAVPGYLATTISSGGGTTTLTLAANAATAVSGANVYHDNVPALAAAANAASATGRTGTVYIPNLNTVTPYLINSSWRTAGVRYVIAGGLSVVQPILPASGATFEGWPGTAFIDSPPFGRGYFAQVTCGTSDGGSIGGGIGCPYPFFYVQPTRSNVTFRNLDTYAIGNQIVGVLVDAAPDGSSSTDLTFDNVYFNLGAQGTAVELKGGFGFRFTNSGFNAQNSVFGSPQAVRSTLMHSASGSLSLAGIVHFDECYFGGTGVQVDTLPNPAGTGGGQFYFRNTLMEGGTGNVLRINVGGNVFTSNYFLQNVDYSDPRGGLATAMIDVSNSTNVNGVTLDSVTPSNVAQPLVVGNPAGLIINGGVNQGGVGVGSATYLGVNSLIDSHGLLTLMTNGAAIVPVSPPSSTPAAVVGSGGSVPLGTWTYAVTKVDYNGRETVPGPPSASVLVTSGNQTVTVDCSDTVGGNIQFLRIYRSSGGGYAEITSGHNLTTCHAVDASSTITGAVAGNLTTAGDPVMDASGVATSKLRLGGELLQAAPRAALNVFLSGALTTTWTGATWTPDKAITVTRVEAQAKSAPAGCTTNAVVRLTDGSSPVNVTLSAAANSSGAVSQNYAAGAPLTVGVATPAAGCSASPADVNVIVQYRMQ